MSDELLKLDEKGNPPKTRVASPEVFGNRAKQFWDADALNREKRFRYKKLFANAKPLSEAKLKELGMSDYPNLPSGRAKHKLFMANSSMYDVINSVDYLGYWEVDPYQFRESSKEYSIIISEEVQRMFDENWTSFEYEKQYLINYFNMDGVAIAYFEDEEDWRWRATNLDRCVFPRDTNACGTPIQEVYWMREYYVNELFAYIKNWNKGKGIIDPGWNVKAVIEAINRATENYQTNTFDTDYEYYLRVFKNNDFAYSDNNSARIKCWHGLIKEFDGTVTFCIQTQDNKSEYLYQRISLYPSMDDAIVVFPRDIGVDGTLYGVTGLGETIYPEETVYTRTINDLVATSQFAARMIVPLDETDKGNVNISLRGPFAFVDSSFKSALNASQVPNPAQILAPIQNILDYNLDTKAGAYNASRISPALGKTPPSATQVEYDALQMNMANNTVVNMFYRYWERLLNAQRRRMQRKDVNSQTESGKLIFKLFERLKKRGVPLEAFYSVQNVKAIKSIGAGSPNTRRIILEQLMNVRGELSPQNAKYLTRLWVGSWAGFDMADRLIPKDDVPQLPSAEEKKADLENSIMRLGDLPKVYGDESHDVHLTIHLNEGLVTMQSINEQQIDPQQGVEYLQRILMHAEQHLVIYNPMPSKAQEKANLQQIYQNLLQFTANATRQLQAEKEKQIEEMQRQQQESSQQLQQQGTQQDPYLTAQQAARLEMLKQQIVRNNLMNQQLMQKIEANAIKTQQYIERQKVNQQIKMQNQEMKIRDYKLKEYEKIKDLGVLTKNNPTN